MTRINTNVSSLVAQNTLGRSNASLNQALTRLSTGLRINTGKDDPAGLIASENLRSDITSVKKAIGNTDRANQVIATADSALGQVSSLLNDIRGLVTESANAGVQSQAQLDANQAQVDSSLDALNRIAQTTTFQGRKLLDGSLDFLTTAGTNFSKLQSLQIDQANLGATGAVPVNINVTSAATKAQVNVTNVPSGSGTGVAASTTVSFNSQAAAGTAATGSVSFTVGTAASSGTLNVALVQRNATGAQFNFDTTGAAGLTVTIVNGGAADGAAGGDGTIDLVINDTNDTTGTITGAAFAAGTITIDADLSSGTLTEADIATAIQNINGASSTFTVAAIGTTALVAGDAGSYNNILTGGREASTEAITVTGAAAGISGNVSVTIAESGNVGNAAVLSGSAGAGYTVTVDNTTTVAAIAAAINGAAEINASTASTATYFASVDTPPATLSLTNGAQGTRTIDIASLATTAGSNLNLTFAGASGGPTNVTGSNGTYTINFDSDTATLNSILSQIEGLAEVDVAATVLGAGAVGTQNILSAPGGSNAIVGYTAPVFGNDVITIEAASVGTAGNLKTVTVQETANGTLFDAQTGVGVVDDGNGNLTISLNTAKADIDIDDIANAIDALTGYTASVTSAEGSGVVDASDAGFTVPTVNPTSGGAAAGGLAAAVVIELAGLNGSEVLSFGAGTSLTQLVSGINLVKDATGVEAIAAGTTLQLRSTEYGSEAVVDLKVISEGVGSTIFSNIATNRDTGTDVAATVNGVVANGKGNRLQINTSTLDLTTSVEAGFEGLASFTITGGGALFQLGPDVVSNQQARLGITSVNTARLGGVSGKLYELANGNAASLQNDPTSAARIVEEAIDQVTSLRGRLGAFQRTTLETNKQALNDTLVNLSDAESSIRDADFAQETAALTRAQILVQSGTTVLQIANSNPQNVLALLRG